MESHKITCQRKQKRSKSHAVKKGPCKGAFILKKNDINYLIQISINIEAQNKLLKIRLNFFVNSPTNKICRQFSAIFVLFCEKEE